MSLGAADHGLPLLFQLTVLAVIVVALMPLLEFFGRRWDRLVRHRYVRWHRGDWREETHGHMLLYRDAICRCCRRWEA